MPLSNQQKQAVEAILVKSIRTKLNTPNREPNDMPFHTRLLGSERLAVYSFIHSLNTNFGTTIFEAIAETLANSNFQSAQRNQVVGNEISEAAQTKIQNIINDLQTGNSQPNAAHDTREIRQVAQQGGMVKVKPTKADLVLTSATGEQYFIDLKTAKPNKDGFEKFKRTLLEWKAIHLAKHPNTKVNAFIAIPYNPYDPTLTSA